MRCRLYPGKRDSGISVDSSNEDSSTGPTDWVHHGKWPRNCLLRQHSIGHGSRGNLRLTTSQIGSKRRPPWSIMATSVGRLEPRPLLVVQVRAWWVQVGLHPRHRVVGRRHVFVKTTW